MKDPVVNHLLARLKELRELHGHTQESFVEMAGFSYKYYQAIEAGRRRDIRLSTLERLAGAYGLEVYELLSPQLPRSTVKKLPKETLLKIPALFSTAYG